MRTDQAHIRRLTLALLLLGLGLGGAGCQSARAPAPRAPAVFYPGGGETPRLQFLATLSAPEDVLPPPSPFRLFLTGAPPRQRPILKPYGLALRGGVLSVCDTVSATVHRIDLRSRAWAYFQPAGSGRLQKVVNADEDAQGLLAVSDTLRGQVLLFDRTGAHVGCLGAEGELKPADVRLHGGEAYVADLKSRRVRVYGVGDRAFRRAIPAGEPPKDQDLFAPTNLAVAPGGDVYVSDAGAFRVQRYTAAGAFVRSYGRHGDTPGSFARNKGVAVDRDGRVYVVDAAFQNVQIFDAEGRLLLHFGDRSEPHRGLLDLPAGILIDYDHVPLFSDAVAPGRTLEYLVLVSSQYGPDKVNVYGFLHQP